MASVTINGNTYSDDSNASTGLANGGHRTRFIPLIQDVVTVAGQVETNKNTAVSSVSSSSLSASTATAQASAATAQAGIAATQASAAATSASQSATSASQSLAYRDEAASLVAQAVPTGPIRLQSQTVSEDFTVASDYHGLSMGPLLIAAGITVTVQPGSTWAIV